MRYLIRLKYNGEHFHGWQIQPNAITVQEVLEQKLSMVLTKEVKVVGCGRTDTGVHASDYYAHFDLLDCKYSSKKLLFKLNCVLPDAIVYQNYELYIKIFMLDLQQLRESISIILPR